MNKRRIFAIIGLVFAFTGLVCFGVSIFCRTENNIVVNLGLASTFIAFIFVFILNRKSKPQEETDQNPDQNPEQ